MDNWQASRISLCLCALHTLHFYIFNPSGWLGIALLGMNIAIFLCTLALDWKSQEPIPRAEIPPPRVRPKSRPRKRKPVRKVQEEKEEEKEEEIIAIAPVRPAGPMPTLVWVSSLLQEAAAVEKEKPLTVDIPANKPEEECIICLENKKTHIAVPCGHLLTCNACSAGRRFEQCPLCRKPCRHLNKVHD